MKGIQLTGLLVVQLLPAMAAHGAPAQRTVQPGDTYEITKTRDSSSQDSDASSGSTHDQDTFVERIEAVRPDGLEAVFDLPQRTTKEERRQVWQFPARVFKPRDGQFQLLNAPELEKRVDSARRAHFQRLALKSAQARRRKAGDAGQ